MIKKCIIIVIIFGLGLAVHAYPWKACWISTDACQSEPNTWLNYRKVVDIAHVPAVAKARIAVDSKYWLWINGESVVFEGGLKRGPNPRDTYYDEVDIASYLKEGSNTIAILVWYFGKQGFSHNSSGKAGLLFDCQTEGLEILSDKSWECAVNPAYHICEGLKPNYRLSESDILFDARQDVGRWYEPAWNASFPHASELQPAGGSPWNALVKRPVPLWKDYGLKSYRKTYMHGDTLVCELPYNAQVTPYLKIKGKSGAKVVMATDNYFYYNGATENVRAEYIAKEGVQEYESLGWMNGHRVYYILSEGIEVLDVKYRETGYDCEFAGYFESSDTLLNKLWAKSARTLYVTMRDTYMDCPERERAQWTGDAVNESGETFYALSVSSHALTRKWLYELIGWQKDDGVIYAPVPAGNWTLELPCQTLASVGYYGVWNYYMHTGDKQTLKDVYPAIKRYLSLWKDNGMGLVAVRDGGWLWGDWGDNRDILLLVNCWYYLALKGMRQMALVLDYSKDVEMYAGKMSALKQAFNAHCWTGKAYRDSLYKGETDDRVQALAVLSGLADEIRYKALLEVFKTEFHASPYMEKYVFEAMMKMGYVDEALERHKQRMAYMGNDTYFSTLFEHWYIGIDGYEGGSVNHAWTGGGLTVLSQYLCGISPLEAGYKSVRIMPSPGYVAYASAGIESVKGPVSSAFRQMKDKTIYTVSAPCGMDILMCIPAVGVRKIKINGELIWEKGKFIKNEIVRLASNQSERHVKFVMRGGTYRFESFK